MILSAQSIRKAQPITPFCERTKFQGLTYGLGPAGYDLRIAQTIIIHPGEFKLVSTLEEFMMPNDLQAVVHDKSTWARMGLCVQNTVIDPGFKGGLTLELTNHNHDSFSSIQIVAGTPICQVVFHKLDFPTEIPYKGKYQNQKTDPQEAILETNSTTQCY